MRDRQRIAIVSGTENDAGRHRAGNYFDMHDLATGGAAGPLRTRSRCVNKNGAALPRLGLQKMGEHGRFQTVFATRIQKIS
jgi:hypothetical protein